MTTHYCNGLSVNHQLNLDIDLPKKVTRNELYVDVYLAKAGTILKEFEAKIGRFF